MACARTAQLQLQRLLPRASSSFSVITTATRIDPWGQAHRIFAGGAACHWNRRETGSLFIATGIHVRVEVAAAGGGGRRSCGYTRRCIQRACFYGRNSGARSWLKLWCSWSFDTLIRSRGTITCTQASNTCKENRKKEENTVNGIFLVPVFSEKMWMIKLRSMIFRVSFINTP